ncbi:MAG: hypothetical protein ACFCD0_19560 [Gemmataceae bacterium]
MHEDDFRKPPWMVFSYAWGSKGWRTGGGEMYWIQFTEWFRSLTVDSREQFITDYPEPPDWKYFYEYIGLPQADRKGRDRLHPLITANWQAYQSTEYEKARAAEEDGQIATALYHLQNASQHGEFQDVSERCARLRQLLRKQMSG